MPSQIAVALSQRPVPTGTAVLGLREALSGWFGTPLNTTVPLIDRLS